MNNKYITSDLWDYIEKQNTKIAKKVYNIMNHDNFSLILESNNIFYFEKTWSGATIPNYVYEYVKKWAKKQGYTYLYDYSKGFTN